MKFFDAELFHVGVKRRHIFSSEQWEKTFKFEPLSSFSDWQQPERELYSRAFHETQRKIHNLEWQKGVPVAISRLKSSMSRSNLTTLLHTLGDVPEALIPFGFWDESGGVIGASPEILYYRNKNKINSMALAGTQKKPGPCILMSDVKNRKEHQFVIDELRKKWERWGDVLIHDTEVLELPALYHLLTKISVNLRQDVSVDELVQSLHPTSALGVFPHERWQELLALPWQDERDYFGAPLIFPLSELDESLAIISLRQIQWNSREVKLVAGGGVVEESQEELEWAEILAKMDSVKKLLKI